MRDNEEKKERGRAEEKKRKDEPCS